MSSFLLISKNLKTPQAWPKMQFEQQRTLTSPRQPKTLRLNEQRHYVQDPAAPNVVEQQQRRAQREQRRVVRAAERAAAQIPLDQTEADADQHRLQQQQAAADA